MTQETYDLVWQQFYKSFEKPDGQLDGEGLERAITDFWQLPLADAANSWAARYRQLATAAHSEGIRWRAGDGARVQPEVWAGLPLAPLDDPIGWPDRTRRFQLYRWDVEQQKLVSVEVQADQRVVD